ncbi:MFS transporter [Prauserella flavalba]|uniref:MFS transporter n=1 Tax=Prauserella flavalba TaxID=1477506 RepID=UPI001AEFD776|nr:MFS transporter [Prauserella flavalba]
MGTFIEFYDFAIYGYTSATIATLFFPGSDPAAALLATFAVYGVAFVMRPLGGVFFGRMGDRIGRRRVLTIVLSLVGVSTAAIGCLPTHAQIGTLAPLLLVLCRLVQGFSAGGEAVGAISFAYEHAPANRRGLWAATVIAVGAVPSMFSALLVLGISNSMSAEAYTSWGWRIPFLIAIPLSVVALYLRLKTDESPAFEQARKNDVVARSPLRTTISQHYRTVLWIVAFSGLSALGYYLFIGYLVPYIEAVLGLDQDVALISNALGVGVYAVALPLAGLVGDHIGRKKLLIVGSAAIAVVSVPAFLLVSSGSLAAAIAGQCLLALCVCVFGGATYCYCVELFPTNVRFTAGAIGYNVGFAAFGGSAPYVSQYLVNTTGSSLAPGFYVGAVALLVFLACWKAPLSRTDPAKAREAGPAGAMS